MRDISKSIDARCGTSNNYTALTVFTTSSTSFLMLLSIPLNALVVFVLIEDRKQRRYKTLFYKLLLNIAVADLLTGLVADPCAVNAVVKETLRVKISQAETYLAHLSLFFTDAVALCTLTLLSMDRVVAIMSPVKHFKGMKQATRYVLVACTWIIGFCLVLPYFKLGFIRQLLIFSTINITITVLSLIVTTVMYRLKLKPSTSNKHKIGTTQAAVFRNRHSGFVEIGEDNNLGSLGDADVTNNNSDTVKISNNRVKVIGENRGTSGDNFMSKKQARNQQKATRTFLIMLCVFVVTYLPTAVTMILMNVCTTCDCLAIHIMRDVSIISILSSSVFRPLNFILTLKHLRTSVFLKLRIKKRQSRDDSTLSFPNGSRVASSSC